jgi:uncharacterized membrane protein/mono/diheme cytochrome c family protein
MAFRTRQLLYALGILVIAALAVVAWKAPPDGLERGDFYQFLGRFHPLVVHLPIGLVLLTAVLELAGFCRNGKHLRAASGFVLGLATASALISVWLGWLLAWSGGYEGRLVTRHMWGGISLAIALVFCCALRVWNTKAYGAALIAAVCVLVWTSDQGGKLTHGEAFLTEHMPAKLRSALHVPPPKKSATPHAEFSVPAPAAPTAAAAPAKLSVTFFESRVEAIFSDKCVTCHGSAKTKGKLRLDAFEHVMRGGKHGAVIKPGDPKNSELVRRISLPRDDEHAMPAEGKPGLTDAQIQVIVMWIASGASQTLPAEQVRGAPPLPAREPPPFPLTADYRSRSDTIQSLQSELAIRLVPRSENPRDGLILRAVAAPARCDDAVLAALSPIADLIVDAELARTKITDTGLKTLSTFSNLHSVDLSHTAITSRGLAPLANLNKLESLNLTATDVDDEGVMPLRRKSGLRHLYLFETRCVKQ